MSNAKRDQNRVRTLIGKNSTDATQITLAQINPATGSLKVSIANEGLTVTLGGSIIPRDRNRIPVSYGRTESIFTTTIAPLLISPNGALLVEFP